MFVKRLLSALILLAFAGIALVFGGPFLLLLGTLVSLGGTYELLKIDNMHKTMPGYICYVSVIGFYLVLFWKGLENIVPWLVVFLIVLMTSYVFAYPKYHIKSITMCFLAPIYICVLISFLCEIRFMEYGNWLVWLVIAASSGSDTFAYLTGICIGKHHFSELSPKKTIEGCVGGVVGAAVISAVFAIFLPTSLKTCFSMNVYASFAIMGAVGSGVSQIGDLVASAIKRNYGVKDYSKLIPGHGGILDRFDSIIFVSPIIYYMLLLFM